MGEGGKEPEGRRKKEAEGRRDTGDKRRWMKGWTEGEVRKGQEKKDAEQENSEKR